MYAAHVELYDGDDPYEATEADKMAWADLVLLDVRKIQKDEKLLCFLGDDAEWDIAYMLEAVEVNGIMEMPLRPDFSNLPTSVICIDTLFVKEEYRKEGVGRWLLKNLTEICEESFNTCVRCFVTCIEPMLPDEQGVMQRIDDDSEYKEEMLRLLKRIFEKNGYQKIKGAEECYCLVPHGKLPKNRMRSCEAV